MRPLFYKFWRAIAACYAGWSLIAQLTAVVLTYALVASGFDWTYFEATRSPVLAKFFWPAVFLGGILPIVVPLLFLAYGRANKNFEATNTGWALGQAALSGLLVSSAYKAFTGRVPPVHAGGLAKILGTIAIAAPHPRAIVLLADISREFQFGFFRGGVFWGWPSSHTTIAFAMAATLIALSPKKKWAYAALAYAFYVGIGVSMTIHWFSEFAAGAIIGTVIGIAVGRSFRARLVEKISGVL